MSRRLADAVNWVYFYFLYNPQKNGHKHENTRSPRWSKENQKIIYGGHFFVIAAPTGFRFLANRFLDTQIIYHIYHVL
jgi:extradiol dioxygenase family protein